MTYFDVFNGDADGICALLQLRLANPLETTLVTGVKRDIALVEQVQAKAHDSVTVLDISMKKNQQSLRHLLAQEVDVFYCDHHQSGDIPDSPRLTALINESPNVCTSLLINGHLSSAFPEWAIVGAYGDNLAQSAEALAKKITLSAKEVALLQQLGELFNYNAYGASIEDLHIKPDNLFLQAKHFAKPQIFCHENKAIYRLLLDGYQTDMQQVNGIKADFKTAQSAVYILPDEPFARRSSGVYANSLANQYPDRAHAILTERPDQTYLVSVRAPLNNKQGADKVCSQFATGGGRAAAAGINMLAAEELTNFIDCLENYYQQ